jgi:opacity protein-like surface antigen
MSKQPVPRPLSLLFRRPFFLFPVLALFGVCALFGNQALGQTLKNFDVAINFFGQFTGSTSGNGIHDTPSVSSGALVSMRQSFRPWLGYEVNYSYTRFSEAFSTLPFHVQDNLHEASGAYLVQGPKLLSLQPFAAAGAAYLLFLPTSVGGQHFNQQGRVAFLYELGVNYPILTDHFGLRLEYRGLSYKTPDFNQPVTTTNTRRQTSEPAFGLYARF